jgi:predicted O-methyltransferase YrrM
MEFKEILERGIWMTLPEAELLYKTATELHPIVILEIGGAVGASSMILGTVAKEHNGYLCTIEQNPHQQWHDNMKHFGLESNSTLLKGYSPWVGRDYDTPNKIDYLLIDGNHDTRWVLADYHYWEVFVRKGGRIAFHDWTNPHKKEQVQRAVKIIRETDNLKEVGRVDSQFGLIVFEKTKPKFDFKPRI